MVSDISVTPLFKLVWPYLKEDRSPLISKVFTSAGTSTEGHVHAVDDEDDDADISQFIYHISLDQELNNWSVINIPEVVFSDM